MDKVKSCVSDGDLLFIEEMKKSGGYSSVSSRTLVVSPAGCVAWLLEKLKKSGFEVCVEELGCFCTLLYGMVEEELLWLKMMKR